MELNEIKDFFKGKRVMITGHTGFVGAWLCVALDYFGAELMGFALHEEENSLYEKIKKYIKIHNYYGDIADKYMLEKCIDEFKPEIIFHNAAFVFIIKCEKNPLKTFSTNVMGTVNLMEIIRNRDYVKSIVFASSDKVYKNSDEGQVLFKETDEMDGGDPYSCSKTCQDLIIQSYYNTYFKQKGIEVNIFRPSNMIGGGDHNKIRLIPSIINSIQTGRKLELRNPDSVRPWQHILDVIDAYINVLYANWGSGSICIYNLGPTPDNICSVRDIVEIISNNIKNEFEIINNKNNVKIEKRYLGLSIDKLEQEVGWTPKKTLRDTLIDVYEFYENEKEVGAYDLCRKSIEEYYV